jgi:hypothetical protein
MKKIIVLGILFLSSISFAQDKELCKKWLFNFKTVKSIKVKPSQEEKNYSITFFQNFKFEEIENGSYIYGKWKWNKLKNKIILVGYEIPNYLIFNILKLTHDELVFETKDIMNETIVMHLKSDK